MRHFAAAKHDGSLHLVTRLKELYDVSPLGLEVVLGSARAELHFLHFDRPLVFARLVLPLAELVEVFAVVDDAAHGRVRCGRNFHEVQSAFASNLQRLVGGHDAQLVAVVVDNPDFSGANPLIHTNRSISNNSSLLA